MASALLKRVSTITTTITNTIHSSHSPPAAQSLSSSSLSEKGLRGFIHIRVLEGRDLISADSNGLSDPFIKGKIGGEYKQKSEVFRENLYPVFNTDFSFPVTVNHLSEDIRLEVMDYDKMGKNDFLGMISLKVRDIIASEERGLVGWYRLMNEKGQELVDGMIYLIIRWDKQGDRFLKIKEKIKKESEQLTVWQQQRSSLIYHTENNYYLAGKQTQITNNYHKNSNNPVYPYVSKEEKKEEVIQLSVSGHDEEKVTLFIATWNVGNAPPPEPAAFKDWLKPGYDIYAVGVQECQYPSNKGPMDSCAGHWERTLNEYFQSIGDYAIIAANNLMEIRLHVFANKKNKVFHKIGKMVTVTEATGLANIVGNKGGVFVSFHIDHIRIAFVSSHLAAHQGKTLKRNQDVHDIIKGSRLGPNKIELHQLFDYIFWIGDLNYRLDYTDQGLEESPTDAQFNAIMEKINENDFAPLLEKDQLINEMKNNRVFIGYEEGVIRFRPTFKVLRHTDKIEYTTKRSPAYCDRILWKIRYPAKNIHQLEYNSAESINTSDHKPVYSSFELPLFSLPPAVDPLLGPLSLRFLSLAAKNLRAVDNNGTSDPYIEFVADFLVKNYCVPRKQKTLTPEWGADEIPLIECVVNNKQRLNYCHLIVIVRDHNEMQAARLLGQGLVHLGDDRFSSTPQKFSIELNYGGLPAGRVEGEIALQWGLSSFKPIPIEEL